MGSDALGHEGGVIVSPRDRIAIAGMVARRGRRAELDRTFRTQFGIGLPSEPIYMSAGAMKLLGIAPSTWLFISEDGDDQFARSVALRLGALAAVADQSDGLVVLRLTGAKVREALAKLVFVDLHPRTFAIGRVAVTVSAHVSVILWRLPDGENGFPAFDVAIPRSFASSFWLALTSAAAEFGIARQPGG